MHARLKSFSLAVILTATAGTALCSGAAAETPTGSNTVIGPNVLLSDGAEALMKGQWERGVELTKMGLAFAVGQEDRAAAYANLCAGYGALKQYQRALENCDLSLAITQENWRAWQNRAAANLGLGKIEESLRDIQRGLQLNPDSDALQKTLAIARDYEKQHQERMRHLLES